MSERLSALACSECGRGSSQDMMPFVLHYDTPALRASGWREREKETERERERESVCVCM